MYWLGVSPSSSPLPEVKVCRRSHSISLLYCLFVCLSVCLQDGDKFWKMPECFIRGSTIKYLRIPDEVRERWLSAEMSPIEGCPLSGLDTLIPGHLWGYLITSLAILDIVRTASNVPNRGVSCFTVWSSYFWTSLGLPQDLSSYFGHC